MIEFRGDYYKKGHQAPQAVLVQFDGVLLHVWYMAEPFHRLLTSDVFHLPACMGKRNRYIKLPNGSRIETDDLSALGTIQSNRSSTLSFDHLRGRYFRILTGGGIILIVLTAAYMIAWWASGH